MEASDGPSPASAEPAAEARAPSVVVRVSPERVVVPPECACCGAPGPRTRRERRADGRSLLVPLCTTCHAHASREDSRLLAVGIASLLLAGTALAGLPLLVAPPLAVYLLVVLLAGLVPAVVLSFARRPAEPGHASSGRAVFFRWDGALVCRSEGWGRRLAALSSAAAERSSGRVRDPVSSPVFAAVLGVVVALGVPLYFRLFPEVRIVNVGDTRLEIRVDGALRATVGPTSAESPNAGVVIRVPSGRRRLVALDPMGVVRDSSSVLVTPGALHLYAPASAGTCFRIETTGYGRASRGAVPEAEDLRGTPRFWAIPGDVDYWFRPPPAPADDDRSSGGLLRALRQVPCGNPGIGGEGVPMDADSGEAR
ncbi:MAG TPA: hypothetical protein VHE30_02655 [Polyangiaceae bacterium]|nr:hypothetical protein [Polyangiaceae bacterium]